MAEEASHKPYRLGLALSGSEVKGFVHVGIFRMTEECALRPDVIVGTSAGALMGALSADGYSAAGIQELFIGRGFSEFAQLQIPKVGLFDSKHFRCFLRRHLRTKNIEDLQIPLMAVAAGSDNGESHEFRGGPVVEAVTTFCSVPVIFGPVIVNGVYYVNGGLSHGFPVLIIREKCEYIIRVSVSPLIPQKYKQTTFHIVERSYHCMLRADTLKDRETCDVLMEAERFGLYKTSDLKNVGAICNIDYSTAARCFEKVLDENKYGTLVKAIAARRKGLMP